MSLWIATLFYISSPAVEMREHPKKDSELVSQAYFSEKVDVIEKVPHWTKIETHVDHYQGWIQDGALCAREEAFSPSVVAKTTRCSAHLYGCQDTIYGPILTLPFDSILEVQTQLNSRWLKVLLVDGSEGYIQSGDVTLNPALLDRAQMCTLSLQFLGLPYTWAGRSSFGYDCSGFVQMLYRQMGIYLPRDSKDQIRWEGFTSIPLEQLLPGDLIFFGLSENQIRHVGMSLGGDQFIHSDVHENKPYIRISSLNAFEWNGSGKFTYRAARQLIAHPN